MKAVVLVIRVGAAFFGIAILAGIVMFSSTNHPASVGVPLAILTLAVAPAFSGKAMNYIVLGSAAGLMILDYTLSGVHFIDATRYDADARAIHFVALAIALSLGLYRVFLARRTTK